MALHEREFFDERPETKPATFTCPRCRFQAEYQIRWIRRTKKASPPRGADERDRALFPKLRNYLIRVDDVLACKKCGRRFEIPSQQSLAFF
jgi:transcription elongation factor Elf1